MKKITSKNCVEIASKIYPYMGTELMQSRAWQTVYRFMGQNNMLPFNPRISGLERVITALEKSINHKTKLTMAKLHFNQNSKGNWHWHVVSGGKVTDQSAEGGGWPTLARAKRNYNSSTMCRFNLQGIDAKSFFTGKAPISSINPKDIIINPKVSPKRSK